MNECKSFERKGILNTHACSYSVGLSGFEVKDFNPDFNSSFKSGPQVMLSAPGCPFDLPIKEKLGVCKELPVADQRID